MLNILYRLEFEKHSFFPDNAHHIDTLANLLYPWTQKIAPSLRALQSRKEGKGIVILSGLFHFESCLNLLVTLKNLNSTLPIQIAHNGDKDLPQVMQKVLKSLGGVEMLDLSKIFDGEGDLANVKGWSLKPFAMLASRFKEAMFLDADAVPLRNPRSLFQNQIYMKYGTLYFK